ncbi:MAG: LysR substrate-binding domain-containing protein [Hyphomicrobiaceae bacterium]
MEIFDPELLRTFLAFVDGGSLARASAIVHRSPSAVTAQMQRLEELVGEPLLVAAGRGRALTPAGEDLVGHARRIMAAHREAWLSLKGARAGGRVSIGATQDFADSVLPDLIGVFARTHPRVRLELRIGRSGELSCAFESGEVDVAITLRAGELAHEVGVVRESMEWMCASGGLVVAGQEVPLALLDPPCGFRAAAISALEKARRPYRIAATSSSLAGLRAAVRGGIAVTLRTARWIGPGVGIAPAGMGLPKVGEAAFSIRLRADADPAAADFARLVCEELSSNLTLEIS